MQKVENNLKNVIKILKMENNINLVRSLKNFSKYELSTQYSVVLENIKSFTNEYNKSRTIRFIMDDIISYFSNNGKQQNNCWNLRQIKQLIAEILINLKYLQCDKFDICKNIINIVQANFQEKDRLGIYEEIFMNLKHLEAGERNLLKDRIFKFIKQFYNKEYINQIKVLELRNIFYDICLAFLNNTFNLIKNKCKNPKVYSLLNSVKIFKYTPSITNNFSRSLQSNIA